jgi:hypothetical protein
MRYQVTGDQAALAAAYAALDAQAALFSDPGLREAFLRESVAGATLPRRAEKPSRPSIC